MTKTKTLSATVAAKPVVTEVVNEWWAKSLTPPKQQNKILQVINFNLGSFDDKNRSFLAIGSTPCVDRQGDVVKQDGWDLTNFKNNPVIPWAHDYYQPPVARATEIGVTDGVLQFVCQFPPAGLYEFADTIWNLYRNQFMFAFSVGFIPEEPEDGYSWEGNEFAKCELLEISAVVVPANPQALALAAKQGIIDTAQTRQLISKLEHTTISLKDILSATASEDEAVESSHSDADISKAVADGITKALTDLGIVKTESDKDLTNNNAKKDNEVMVKNKDLSESGSGAALTPTQHAGVKKIADSMKAMGDVLADHAKALSDHSDTMQAHAKMVTEKADLLKDHVTKLYDLLDHDGDETSRDGSGNDDADEQTTRGVKAVKDAVVKDAVAADEVTEDSSQDAADKVEDTTNVDGEVKSQGDEATAETDAADVETEEVAADEVETKEVETEAVEEEVVAADADGADHEEVAEEVAEVKAVETAEAEDELFDANDLTDEQVEKILAAVNQRVKNQ